MHVINGTEFVESLNSSSDGRMLTMWDVLTPQPLLSEKCERPDCKVKQSKIYSYINNPLP